MGEAKSLWLVYIHVENKGMGLKMLLILYIVYFTIQIVMYFTFTCLGSLIEGESGRANTLEAAKRVPALTSVTQNPIITTFIHV